MKHFHACSSDIFNNHDEKQDNDRDQAVKVANSKSIIVPRSKISPLPR
jgi:hypothetical protein